MEFKQIKTPWFLIRKKTKNENEEHTDGEQAFEYSSQQSEVPDLIEACNKKLLHNLKAILKDKSAPEDFDAAAGVLKTMSQLNNNFSEDWLCEFCQEIDQFVERHFPALPAEGSRESQSQQIQDFLKSAQSMIYDKMYPVAPALRDAGLLDHLNDSYSRHLFTNLELLLNRDLSVNEIFCHLLWGKDVFFSSDSHHFFKVHDPLLLTRWFERATEKLLPKLQDDISRTLKNILDYDEQTEDSMDEETFIRVHLDITQCLNAVIQSCKEFSHTLMCLAQTLCLKELHHFVQEYMYIAKEQLEKQQHLKKNSMHLFRLMSTCRQLRFYAPRLKNQDTNSDDLSNIIHMLEELEDHVLSVVQKMLKDIAQTFLRNYFKKGGEQIQVLTEAIQKQCVSLPQTDEGKNIQEIFVNVFYDCVSHVYLDYLMKSKFRRLKRRWGNVGERMREDACNLHNTFTELHGSDDQMNHLLQRFSEVLLHSDVEALKITCCELFRDFPQESDQYLAGLLRWKGMLSERQLREVLDVSREVCLGLKPRRFTCQPLKGLLCLLSYE